MTKQELDILGYTYTNITSGYVGINYSTLLGAGEEFVSEILDTLKPVVTESNLIDIIIGMDENDIPTGLSHRQVAKISVQELPDTLASQEWDDVCRIDKTIDQLGTYQTDYLCYAYRFGNEMQKKSKSGQARAERLKEQLNAIVNSTLHAEDLKSLSLSFAKISSVDDIEICLYQTFPKKDSGTLYRFNRHGLAKQTAYVKGKIETDKIYEENALVETTYHDGLAVRTQKTITGMHGASDVIVTTPTYEDGHIVKSKTTHSKRLAEGFKPVCYVHRYYNESGEMEQVKINDAKYGKKLYTLDKKGFTVEDETGSVSFTGEVAVSAGKDPMSALKELLLLEGALLELKSHVPEYKMDYQAALNQIYTQKVNYAIDAMKSGQALLYIADKGNMTIYDQEGKKAVYFPVSIIKQYLPTYKNYPNVLVEQKIKEGSDPEAIRRLYEFGASKTDADSIYAFHRVIKALSKNPATPSDILKQIVNGIHEGKYDNANLVMISANPNADTDTLQEILNHKPSVLVKSHIENHPNRPKKIKAQVTEKAAENAAKKLFG